MDIYTGLIYEVRMVLKEDTRIYQPMGFAFDEYEAISYARWLSESKDVEYAFIDKCYVLENNRTGIPIICHRFFNGLEMPISKR